MSTAWQPFDLGKRLLTLVDLEGLLIPNPDALQGWIAYVVDVPAPISGPAYYSFSLDSGAPLDPVNVRPTMVGGDSRWIRLEFGQDGPPLGGPVTPILPNDAEDEGVSTSAARSDHQHAIETEEPGVILPNDAPNEGVADSFCRSDHRHGIATDEPVPIGDALSEGVSDAFARADHVHTIPESEQSATLSAYADIPAPGKPGRIFTPSDGYCQFVDDGAEWRPIFAGKPCRAAPPAAQWGQVNVPGSLTDDKGTLLLQQNPTGAPVNINASVITRPMPAAPYTLSLGVRMRWAAVDTVAYGIVFRDSATGRYLQLIRACTGGWAFYIQRMTDPNTFNSTENSFPWVGLGIFGDMFLHLHDPGGGGNLIWGYSLDGDASHMVQLQNGVARTTWTAAPDQIGMVVLANNAEVAELGKAHARVFDWTIKPGAL